VSGEAAESRWQELAEAPMSRAVTQAQNVSVCMWRSISVQPPRPRNNHQWCLRFAHTLRLLIHAIALAGTQFSKVFLFVFGRSRLPTVMKPEPLVRMSEDLFLEDGIDSPC